MDRLEKRLETRRKTALPRPARDDRTQAAGGIVLDPPGRRAILRRLRDAGHDVQRVAQGVLIDGRRADDDTLVALAGKVFP